MSLLPQALQDWLAFRKTGKGEVPDVPFQMLTQLELSPAQWAQIARGGSWQMVRQGLNTFLRHGAFGRPGPSRMWRRCCATKRRSARPASSRTS
ncbi:MAG: hypothetical protein R3D59_03270 [Paracoccaceae bacterium]